MECHMMYWIVLKTREDNVEAGDVGCDVVQVILCLTVRGHTLTGHINGGNQLHSVINNIAEDWVVFEGGLKCT